MLLNDRQIHELCPGGSGANKMISPFVDHQEGFPSYGLAAIGYDIRLHTSFKVLAANALAKPGMDDSDMESVVGMVMEVPIGDKFTVWPHTSLIVKSREKIKMPTDLMGWVVGKRCYNVLGLLIPSMVINPGWWGYLEFTLTNPTAARIPVTVGGGIAQVIFQRIEEPDLLPPDGPPDLADRYQEEAPETHDEEDE